MCHLNNFHWDSSKATGASNTLSDFTFHPPTPLKFKKREECEYYIRAENVKVPKSFYQVNSNYNTFIVEEFDGVTTAEVTVTLDEGNYNVSGGTVTIDVADGVSFNLSSTANIWDLEIINNTGSGNMTVELDTTLTVSQDFTLNAYCTLDVDDPTSGVDQDVFFAFISKK